VFCKVQKTPKYNSGRGFALDLIGGAYSAPQTLQLVKRWLAGWGGAINPSSRTRSLRRLFGPRSSVLPILNTDWYHCILTFIVALKLLVNCLSCTLATVMVKWNTSLVCQSHDDVAKVRQALVNVLSLLQPLSLRPRLLEAFTSRQINEVQHAYITTDKHLENNWETSSY